MHTHKDTQTQLLYNFYFCSNHWTLIIICPSTERGYIIDSIRREKDQHDYLLTSVIEDAFGFPFLWDMVKVCILFYS